MKCFKVDLANKNNKIKLNISNNLIKLNPTNKENIRLNINYNIIDFQVLNIITNLAILIKNINYNIVLQTLDSIPNNINLLTKGINTKLELNISYYKNIDLIIRRIEEIVLDLDAYKGIKLNAILLCKVKKLYEYLRSLDDESLEDLNRILLKSLTDYGIERIN